MIGCVVGSQPQSIFKLKMVTQGFLNGYQHKFQIQTRSSTEYGREIEIDHEYSHQTAAVRHHHLTIPPQRVELRFLNNLKRKKKKKKGHDVVGYRAQNAAMGPISE